MMKIKKRKGCAKDQHKKDNYRKDYDEDQEKRRVVLKINIRRINIEKIMMKIKKGEGL